MLLRFCMDYKESSDQNRLYHYTLNASLTAFIERTLSLLQPFFRQFNASAAADTRAVIEFRFSQERVGACHFSINSTAFKGIFRY